MVDPLVFAIVVCYALVSWRGSKRSKKGLESPHEASSSSSSSNSSSRSNQCSGPVMSLVAAPVGISHGVSERILFVYRLLMGIGPREVRFTFNGAPVGTWSATPGPLRFAHLVLKRSTLSSALLVGGRSSKQLAGPVVYSINSSSMSDAARTGSGSKGRAPGPLKVVDFGLGSKSSMARALGVCSRQEGLDGPSMYSINSSSMSDAVRSGGKGSGGKGRSNAVTCRSGSNSWRSGSSTALSSSLSVVAGSDGASSSTGLSSESRQGDEQEGVQGVQEGSSRAANKVHSPSAHTQAAPVFDAPAAAAAAGGSSDSSLPQRELTRAEMRLLYFAPDERAINVQVNGMLQLLPHAAARVRQLTAQQQAQAVNLEGGIDTAAFSAAVHTPFHSQRCAASNSNSTSGDGSAGSRVATSCVSTTVLPGSGAPASAGSSRGSSSRGSSSRGSSSRGSSSRGSSSRGSSSRGSSLTAAPPAEMPWLTAQDLRDRWGFSEAQAAVLARLAAQQASGNSHNGLSTVDLAAAAVPAAEVGNRMDAASAEAAAAGAAAGLSFRSAGSSGTSSGSSSNGSPNTAVTLGLRTILVAAAEAQAPVDNSLPAPDSPTYSRWGHGRSSGGGASGTGSGSNGGWGSACSSRNSSLGGAPLGGSSSSDGSCRNSSGGGAPWGGSSSGGSSSFTGFPSSGFGTPQAYTPFRLGGCTITAGARAAASAGSSGSSSSGSKRLWGTSAPLQQLPGSDSEAGRPATRGFEGTRRDSSNSHRDQQVSAGRGEPSSSGNTGRKPRTPRTAPAAAGAAADGVDVLVAALAAAGAATGSELVAAGLVAGPVTAADDDDLGAVEHAAAAAAADVAAEGGNSAAAREELVAEEPAAAAAAAAAEGGIGGAAAAEELGAAVGSTLSCSSWKEADTGGEQEPTADQGTPAAAWGASQLRVRALTAARAGTAVLAEAAWAVFWA